MCAFLDTAVDPADLARARAGDEAARRRSTARSSGRCGPSRGGWWRRAGGRRGRRAGRVRRRADATAPVRRPRFVRRLGRAASRCAVPDAPALAVAARSPLARGAARRRSARGLESAAGERAAADSADAVDLERALAHLGDTARAVVWLHDVEGYTHAEIGALFGARRVFPSRSSPARMRACANC